MAISMEAMLASLCDGKRAFLFAQNGEVDRLLSPRGIHNAVVWSSTVTTSPVLVEQLFPSAPLVHKSIDMPGSAMVEDVAHLIPCASANGHTCGAAITESVGCALTAARDAVAAAAAGHDPAAADRQGARARPRRPLCHGRVVGATTAADDQTRHALLLVVRRHAGWRAPPHVRHGANRGGGGGGDGGGGGGATPTTHAVSFVKRRLEAPPAAAVAVGTCATSAADALGGATCPAAATITGTTNRAGYCGGGGERPSRTSALDFAGFGAALTAAAGGEFVMRFAGGGGGGGGGGGDRVGCGGGRAPAPHPGAVLYNALTVERAAAVLSVFGGGRWAAPSRALDEAFAFAASAALPLPQPLAVAAAAGVPAGARTPPSPSAVTGGSSSVGAVVVSGGGHAPVAREGAGQTLVGGPWAPAACGGKGGGGDPWGAPTPPFGAVDVARRGAPQSGRCGGGGGGQR
ncbi:hypothetical protein BU14_0553s0010 [Porphyra umbilicalis]|uniref:Uncharacterized protein n=1 Tax=Porphyra umbilicalis TaxID=2786 RepID=A0A1X6NSI0_PORUM|nr:hypothetical protein BU14_0553s0010 [Porphyra umbilicalis]|eukprot:OSX71333.1 hypothetical protein BU14_0553s0010 [Porphyra umbilicalis]